MPGVPDGRGPLIVRLARWMSRRQWGCVLDPLRIYALVPRVMMAFGKLLRSIDRPRRLPRALKSLAMARAATRVGCAF
jgi:hypothetical protein